MKIIIIGPAHPLRGGGMATFNERLAKAFMDEGDDTTIYTFALQYPSFLFPGTSQYSNEPAPAGIAIKVLINSINPLNWIKTGKLLKKERPDIIVVRYWLPFMGPCLGTILRIAKKNGHSRVICIADNIIPHEKRPGDLAFTKYFIPPVDAFVTMSEKVMADVKLFSNKPVQFVPHPLYDNFGDILNKQVARKGLGASKNDFIILFFGFIRKYKGVDILLDAMPQIIKEIPAVKLLVAGEYYDDKKNYEEQIERLGIKNHLILHTDFIPNTGIKNYFSAADIVVQPYRNATQSGVTPLAYHFEVPMVVTNVGGLAAMVPNGKVGLVAEPTAASIADKIIEMYRKGPQNFIPFVQTEKKKYSWDKLTETIRKLAEF
ncbi:MAG: glycosyltransferase [Ferruginibacter sp.]